MKRTDISGPDNQRSFNKVLVRSAIVVSLVILGLTLFPFDFTRLGFTPRLAAFVGQRFLPAESLWDDIIVNVVLFVPLGMIFGGLALRRYTGGKSFVLVTMGGALFSCVIEALQLFLPFRFSSIFDIASNTAGSLIGFVLMFLGQARIRGMADRFVRSRATTRLATAFIALLAFFTMLSFPLLHASRFTGWDRTSSFTIGNDASGRRPWFGKISEVAISRMGTSHDEVRKTFSRDELFVADKSNLVCKYEIRNSSPVNSSVSGMPQLVTRRAVAGGRKELVKWLKSKSAAEHLTSSVVSTGRFSLYFTYASDVVSSHAPSSLIAIAKNSEQLNLALTQMGADLIISLRTMATGLEGNKPQFVVPDFFQDTKKHRALITCEKWVLRVYRDSPENVQTFVIGPGLALTNRFLPSYRTLDITSRFADINEVLFALIVTVPLGLISSRMVYVMRRRRLISAAIASAAIVLPALMMGLAIAFMTGRPFDTEHFLRMAILMALSKSLFFLMMVREERFSLASHNGPVSPAVTSTVHEQSY
ncbi:MAG: VanZ family protein [Ignavibacteriae bacterium]|nr:VanZ family protein [Ignavibacteriota bacterium]